jgi:3-hydroxyacyl-CoA dehydrogenase
MFLVGTDQMEWVNTSLSTIRKLLTKHVMAGGDLSEPTMVSEQYLLILNVSFLVIMYRENTRKSQFMLTKGNHYIMF